MEIINSQSIDNIENVGLENEKLFNKLDDLSREIDFNNTGGVTPMSIGFISGPMFQTRGDDWLKNIPQNVILKSLRSCMHGRLSLYHKLWKYRQIDLIDLDKLSLGNINKYLNTGHLCSYFNGSNQVVKVEIMAYYDIEDYFVGKDLNREQVVFYLHYRKAQMTGNCHCLYGCLSLYYPSWKFRQKRGKKEKEKDALFMEIFSTTTNTR